jgi:hypothetical protein
MSDIVPTEAELKAADNCASSIGVFENTARAILRSSFARIIAACTRYEGKTAEEWKQIARKNSDLAHSHYCGIKHWQKFCAKLGTILGCMGIDDDVEQAVVALKQRAEAAESKAEEWARLQEQTAFVVREVNLRAEAAEAKVKELEAKLDAPPTPSYPFGYGYEGKLCECWHICNGHYECWTTNGTAVFNIHQQACQWCGAPRTKGS